MDQCYFVYKNSSNDDEGILIQISRKYLRGRYFI